MPAKEQKARSSLVLLRYPISPRDQRTHRQGVQRRLSAGSCIQVLSLLRWLDYTLVPGMGVSGSVDYRCWPSYSQQGCVLSVHSAREAAFICSSHAQCGSFTLTGQRTWTGELRTLPPAGRLCRCIIFVFYRVCDLMAIKA